MIKPEILAPAGSYEALEAAVRCGADAVYLGLSEFNARKNAKNFTKQELEAAVSYCRVRGVKVYLALNTLLKEAELALAQELFRFACSVPVDAVIVQDLGAASIFRKISPTMPLHASTQAVIHTPQGVKMAAELGFSRAVLARELSEAELAEIALTSPIEIEYFIHGALCMSVSGQCYLSAMLGGRSGNRGDCAQPCRLPFKSECNGSNSLSLKDSSLIDKIPTIAKLGINSIKIEGRMKRPEYVAAAVTACRLARDEGSVPLDLSQKLEAVFSRSGFTQSYFKGIGKSSGEMLGTRRKEDVTASNEALLRSLRALYKAERSSIPLRMEAQLSANNPSSLLAEDSSGNRVHVVGEAPKAAINLPLTAQRLALQLQKTGGTPYNIQAISSQIEEGITLPASALNSLRRSALDAITELRGRADPLECSSYSYAPRESALKQQEQDIRAIFNNPAEIPAAARACQIVFVPSSTQEEQLTALLQQGFSLGVELPRALFGIEEKVRSDLKKAAQLGIKDVLLHNIGAIPLAKEAGMRIHGGFALNLANSAAIEAAQALGVQDFELSIELSLKQAQELAKLYPCGAVAYGHLPLMLLRNCPLSNCKACKGGGELIDRTGAHVPIICGERAARLLNPKPLCMLDRQGSMKDLSFLTLRFYRESRAEAEAVFAALNKGENPFDEFTRGLYFA
ncbi:MAG: DUF3656 domain-containing protein [Oscillospiraceae bacterium]|jgi:putative protease|nr:DUF3656 domain-containing protein [Oscillospiraceae bacterium]